MREDELTCGLVELDDGANPCPSHQMVAHLAVRNRLDGDRDATVGPVERRGQRVRPPLAHPVHVHADPDVLPGGVLPPTPPRLDHQSDRVPGLGVYPDDATAQVGAGAEWADDVEIVRGNQWCGDHFGEPEDAVAKRARSRRVLDSCRHASSIPVFRGRLMCFRRELIIRICSEGTKSLPRTLSAPLRAAPRTWSSASRSPRPSERGCLL